MYLVSTFKKIKKSQFQDAGQRDRAHSTKESSAAAPNFRTKNCLVARATRLRPPKAKFQRGRAAIRTQFLKKNVNNPTHFCYLFLFPFPG